MRNNKFESESSPTALDMGMYESGDDTSYNVPTKFSTTPKDEEVIHMDGSENNSNDALYFWACYKDIGGAKILESSEYFGRN